MKYLQLSKRGKWVLGVWLLFVVPRVVEYVTMTQVTIRYVGMPPKNLSTHAFVEQDLCPDRFVPFWSYRWHVMESSSPIVETTWQQVPLGRHGGSSRLLDRRALSLGAYRACGNRLYVGIEGAEYGKPDGREMGIYGFGDDEGAGPRDRTNVRFHSFNVSAKADAFAVSLPVGAGGEVSIDFTPVLETQVLEPRTPRSSAGDHCNTDHPVLSLHVHEVKRVRYEPIYLSAERVQLRLPGATLETQVFFNDRDDPSAWISRTNLSAVRGRAIQPEGYRILHDAAHHEVYVERDQQAVHRVVHHSDSYNEQLLLMIVTPNPVGDYSGIECFAVEPVE